MLYNQFIRFVLMITLFLFLTLVVFYLHVTNGVFDIPVKDAFKVILGMSSDDQQKLVMYQFRLPRIAVAALAGIGLAIAGTVVQGVTRNGLADPSILGINAGAGTSIVLFMFLFQFANKPFQLEQVSSILVMPLFGFVGGLFAAILIWMFSVKKGVLDMQRLILSGIAISSGFGALTLYISLKMNGHDYETAAAWLVGSIHQANWQYATGMLPWIIILGGIIMAKAHLLDYFQLEEASVIGIGIASTKEKTILLLCAIGIVSACVSVSGGIGFIGLLSPHISRRLVGLKHQYILPMSAVVGMFLLITADFVAKSVFQPIELPAGVVVSIIGIPYFLYLLSKTK